MKILILLPYLLLVGLSICKSSILALPLKVKNTFKGGKAINEIYLSTIAQSHRDFSLVQIETLAEIAYQCPITGGNAVFLARGLYEFVNTEAVYDDEVTCTVQGEQWKLAQMNNKIEYIKLYPNPTDEFVTIILPISQEVTIFSLFNVIGERILTITIPENTSKYQLSIQNVAGGVYNCVIERNKQVLQTEKLIIIHH